MAQLNQATPGRAAVPSRWMATTMITCCLGNSGDCPQGRADTFDVLGLRHTLTRLRDNVEDAVVVPVFDRDLEIARARPPDPRRRSTSRRRGQLLALREPPWDLLETAFRPNGDGRCPEQVLRQRLTSRWQSYALAARGNRPQVGGGRPSQRAAW